MKLIACDSIIGQPRIPYEGIGADKDDLLSEMVRLGISSSIIRHQAALDCGPVIGNELLLKEVKDSENLHGAMFVCPDGFEPDFDVDRMIDQMIESGIRICWTDAQAEEFSLLPWCCGKLYEVLSCRNIPLMIDSEKISLNDVNTILENFPKLSLILLNVPRLGRNRSLYALLSRHPNLLLCLSHTYSVHLGLEDLCKTFGEERWVFGVGYPLAEGGAAFAGLSYADITDSAREAIAYKTIESLLERVV